MKDIGTLIRERREARGITLTELAKKAGCSIATVSAYETGYAKTRLNHEVLERIAKLVGLSFPKLTHLQFWQQRTKGITPATMRAFLKDAEREAAVERRITQLKKKATG